MGVQGFFSDANLRSESKENLAKEAKPKVQGFFSDANLRSESKERLAKKTKSLDTKKKKNHETKPKVQGFFSDANLRSESKESLAKKTKSLDTKKKNMKPSLKFKDFLVTQICALKAKKALLKKPNLWILKKKI